MHKAYKNYIVVAFLMLPHFSQIRLAYKALKAESVILVKGCWYLHPSRAPEATYWMVGVVYPLVQAIMFASCLQREDCVRALFWVHTLNDQLEDHKEQFAEFYPQKKWLDKNYWLHL